MHTSRKNILTQRSWSVLHSDRGRRRDASSSVRYCDQNLASVRHPDPDDTSRAKHPMTLPEKRLRLSGLKVFHDLAEVDGHDRVGVPRQATSDIGVHRSTAELGRSHEPELHKQPVDRPPAAGEPSTIRTVDTGPARSHDVPATKIEPEVLGVPVTRPDDRHHPRSREIPAGTPSSTSSRIGASGGRPAVKPVFRSGLACTRRQRRRSDRRRGRPPRPTVRSRELSTDDRLAGRQVLLELERLDRTGRRDLAVRHDQHVGRRRVRRELVKMDGPEDHDPRLPEFGQVEIDHRAHENDADRRGAGQPEDPVRVEPLIHCSPEKGSQASVSHEHITALRSPAADIDPMRQEHGTPAVTSGPILQHRAHDHHRVCHRKELGVHGLHRRTVEPRPDAEVVDEVVRPVANGDVPHQIDHDGDGGYAGHRTATGQRPLDGTTEDPCVDAPAGGAAEPWPHDRSDHAQVRLKISTHPQRAEPTRPPSRDRGEGCSDRSAAAGSRSCRPR